jgi:hypothetical protein
MKDTVLIDKRIYHLAKDYLPSRKITGVTAVLVEKCFRGGRCMTESR